MRDIAKASGGISLAAIGYHFGSREALMNAALYQAMDDWGAQVELAMAAYADPQAGRVEPFRSMWTEMIKSFTTQRPLWVATLEAIVQAERAPELRDQLADGQQQGRSGMAAALRGSHEGEVSDSVVRTLGSVQTALMTGIMIQWLTDPENAPSAEEVIEGLRAIVTSFDAPASAEPANAP
ncbi:TetR/AcrR family transcriptional regulator [Streptomyces sp. NPDC054786]